LDRARTSREQRARHLRYVGSQSHSQATAFRRHTPPRAVSGASSTTTESQLLPSAIFLAPCPSRPQSNPASDVSTCQLPLTYCSLRCLGACCPRGRWTTSTCTLRAAPSRATMALTRCEHGLAHDSHCIAPFVLNALRCGETLLLHVAVARGAFLNSRGALRAFNSSEHQLLLSAALLRAGARCHHVR